MKRLPQTIKKIISQLGKTYLPNKLKRFIEIQALVILIFILFGDSFKFGHLFGITGYTWIQGHFSDLGLTAQFTTFFYYLYSHRPFGVYLAVSLPPILFTLYELWQYPNTDPIDIACYIIGSLAAFTSITIYKYRIKLTTKDTR
jgi:hypothetical protein